MAWVWSDDLLERFVAAGGAMPEHARRWIDTPVALRVEPDHDATGLARLLDLEELSTVPEFARTMSAGIERCACGSESADILMEDRGVAG